MLRLLTAVLVAVLSLLVRQLAAAVVPKKSRQSAVQTYELAVPKGASEGDRLKLSLPGGFKVALTIPAGAEPGTVLAFDLDVAEASRRGAAVSIQARVRGAKVRNEAEAKKMAAVKIQAHIRAKSARRTADAERERSKAGGYADGRRCVIS